MTRRFSVRTAGAILMASSLATGCGSPAPAGSTAAPATTAAQETSPMTTEDVLKAHMDAFGAGDMDAMLGGYSDDAVMFTPNGIVQGKEALRPVFTALFAEWARPTTKFTLKQRLVSGDYAYIYWDAETDDNVYEGGMDAFAIRNGKKVAHFFSAKITPKTK